jgi:hypothetical protein
MGMVLDHASTSQVLVRSARRKGMKDIVAPMNASVRVEDLEVGLTNPANVYLSARCYNRL